MAEDVLLPVWENGCWGFMDESAKMVIPPAYSNVGEFADGVCAVRMGEKCGYIDVDGEFVIPPRFNDAGDFEDGLAIVEDDEGCTAVDLAGRQLLPGHYGWLWTMGDGISLVAQAGDRGKWGIIDYNGNAVWPFIFDEIQGYDEKGWWKGTCGHIHEFRDNTGMVVRRFTYDDLSPFFADMAVAEDGGRIGVIDRQGNEILPLRFSTAQICDMERICVREEEYGDFVLYYSRKRQYGMVCFECCSEGGPYGLIFGRRDGKWSLFDGDERRVLADIGSEFDGCLYGMYYRFWHDERTMFYLRLEKDAVYRMDPLGATRLV